MTSGARANMKYPPHDTGPTAAGDAGNRVSPMICLDDPVAVDWLVTFGVPRHPTIHWKKEARKAVRKEARRR
jgi:hypothetical protein